jgi:beta-lactamase class A
MRNLVPTLLLTAAAAAGCTAATARGERAPEPVIRPPAAGAAYPDARLEGRIRALVDGFAGDVGVYVRHLGTGATVAIAADDSFPAASMVKVPLLLALHQGVEDGRIRLDDAPAFADSMRPAADDGDVVARFRHGERLSLSKLGFLMSALSDNTASLWIQEVAGGGAAVNAWLQAQGFSATRVNSRTPGREADRRRFGWGQTTPREMAELMVMIREGRAVSPAASERMYRTLSGSYWTGEALSAIPPHVQAASKQGAVSHSRSEVLVVNAPGGDYVLCVITMNQEDRSWDADNAGFVLLREVSRIVYDHFHPADAAGERSLP